ncbi:ATP-binding cassette domain-containing protein [Planococcus versutus]|uniref:ABC transporter n=1 Tax=Planococcus versutus TaxID=1302659 RepID=A0A1B1S1S0_9BACL|nr:ATP-binding cassette domain-containing protein [Planococcus versutus]ANU27148.1 ABC transporter [Planococcus versutus]
MLQVDFQKQLEHFRLETKFELDKEILALVGSSGSGKTTLLNCLAGIVHPDTGQISLNGIDFFNHHQKPLKIQKRKVGYLFQDYALFPHLTVEQNILYAVPRKTDVSHITELTKILGITSLLAKYPHQISGGEKQRVALTRSLAAQPDILLLDEPFSALDDANRDRCQHELMRIHQQWQIPMIFVTHRIADAEKLANQILRIEKGQMTEEPVR